MGLRPIELILGEKYVIGFKTPYTKRVFQLIKSTPKGYNFKNVHTGKILMKHHIYPLKNYPDRLVFLFPYTIIISKYTDDMNEQKIEITAKTPEEFAKILEELNTLSPQVRDQIESAKKGISGGVTCKIKYQYKKELKLTIPANTTAISNSGDRIRIVAGNIVFIIEGGALNCDISYFIEKPQA